MFILQFRHQLFGFPAQYERTNANVHSVGRPRQPQLINFVTGFLLLPRAELFSSLVERGEDLDDTRVEVETSTNFPHIQ